ncbi:hypothetical protein PR048_012782 [Dryococelus australis]|uniref:Reverse transcriptase domain-containing protein n=1 Tax=Dryococelus australis TaxID=614101 RepID=A0ABQ9HQZ3_9NEOP|nr:hypothetical protein PR048_012782 [Dryococelus australis]
MIFLMHCVIVLKKSCYRWKTKVFCLKYDYSQWASPIVCVLKRMTKSYCYSLSKTEDLFQKFHECNVFCRIDLSNAYLRLEVDKSSREFLTINTICGLYVYNRLCFEFSSSVIDKSLEGIKYCGGYQDDILIGGKDYNSCKSVLYAVLSHLNDYKVKINIQKIKSYLGLFNYDHKFIKMAPDVIGPLHNLLRNRLSWEWTDEGEKAFFDDSTYGVGAVLSQLHNGIEKPVAFESAPLNNAQKIYSQLHGGAMSIVNGVTKFHKILMGNQFTIVTDHDHDH